MRTNLSLFLCVACLGCGQLLESPGASFVPRRENVEDTPDAGLPASLTCSDRPPSQSTPPDSVDAELVLFDRSHPYMFRVLEGGHRVELADYTGLSGATLRACALFDPTCSMPVTASSTTDDHGIAHLTVPGAFDGFYQLERNDTPPSEYYPQPPTGETRTTYYVGPINKQSQTAIFSVFQVMVNPERGHLIVGVYDCDDVPLGETEIEIDRDWDVAPYLGIGPTALPTETPNGYRAFVNIAAGETTVVASWRGHVLGTRLVHIRAGHMVLADIRVR